MIEQLFGSKTRVKLLQLFCSNPNRSFYVREITRKIDEQINSVRRELANMLSIGILTSETTNNRVYYEVDQKYEYYQPLSAIFGSASKAKRAKKTGADDEVATQTDESAALKALGNIEAAALMGQFTRDETSGIDMLIVGNVNQHALQKYVASMESQEGKELRYSVMSPSDFSYRHQIKDRFVSNILLSKKQILVDKLDIFS
ncbi:MAG: transcriptional regulator [Candidatus Saccharimonadales bacterium]